MRNLLCSLSVPIALTALMALAPLGCASSRDQSPHVQASSPNARDTDVKITKTLEFAPACAVIDAGETVEWWIEDGAPDVAVNVTSLGQPVELFSPNLVTPYACDRNNPDVVCWRHTFEAAGCYAYFDTNSGSPGRPVVDDYYGTTDYIGESDDVQKALVCVEGPGASCSGVCCNANFDCDAGFECRNRRCVNTTTSLDSPCPAVSAAAAPTSPSP